jgi:hypothetical protein
VDHDALKLFWVMLALSPVVLPGILLGYYSIRQESRKRELEHRERMRSLETGRALPGGESWSISARISLAIGLVVPVGVFFCAALANHAVGFHEGIWKAAGMVGLAGVICGTVLAGISFAQTDKSGHASEIAAGKPEVAEDAYDVVSARG